MADANAQVLPDIVLFDTHLHHMTLHCLSSLSEHLYTFRDHSTRVTIRMASHSFVHERLEGPTDLALVAGVHIHLDWHRAVLGVAP